MAFNMEDARLFTMTDFRDLGRPKGKLPAYPPTLKFTGSKTLRVSGIDFDFLQEIIQNFFSKFTEELKIVEWKSEFSTWNIEYGTRPLEYRSDMDINQVHRIKGAAWRAASKASKTDIPINYGDIWAERKSWHNSELRIYSDPENEGDIILEFLKMRGDHASFWYIFQAFNKYFSNDNVMFWMRQQYLKLANGTEFIYEDHVLRYLLNELIVCDICTYLLPKINGIRPAF